MKPADYVASVVNLLGGLDLKAVGAAAGMLAEAYDCGATVFVCGNGGSASTAAHMAADLSKNTVTTGRPRMRVVSLVDNVAWITALANDNGYASVFMEQIFNLMHRGDLLIALSASGNSPSVVRAAQYAHTRGGLVIALVGFQGGDLLGEADVAVHVKCEAYGPVEDCHLIVNHILVETMRQHIREAK